MNGPVGVILAAGLSTRMGRTKQLLPFGESTVLGTVVRAARRSRLERVIVVLGAAAAVIQDAVDLAGTEVLVNPTPERGNLSSLRMAAGAAPARPLLLLMGDMPSVGPEVIDAHLAAWRKDAAWLRTTAYRDGTGHPLLLSAELAGSLDELEGPKPLWALTMAERAVTLQVDQPMPIDIDTPTDYEVALGRSGRDNASK